MKREAKFILPLLIFTGFVAFAAGALLMGGFSRAPGEIGRPAPLLHLPELGGKNPAGLEAFSGPVFLVNFFASWCVPCIAESDFLMGISRKQRISIIGIAYKDKTANAQRFLQRYGNPYRQVLADQGGQAGIEWGVSGVPETFLINASGRIAAHYAGPLTEAVWKMNFEKLVK
jgi:cytochrome c biogenesis protein CcmG/thiol:disulfide interchange protein DsbE